MNTRQAAEAPGRGAIHLVVMGVSGCGKSAVGQRIAAQLGLPLVEGDDFHPQRNIDKMQQGTPLNDDDRADWLQLLGSELERHAGGAVLTCSALKRAYRDTLRKAVPDLRFVHLAISEAESLRRVASRADHFYPPSLVASQFAALQDPAGEPGVKVVDGTASLDALAADAVTWLRPAAR
jgi:gluconokinase